jgi:hypothetical protein
MWTHLWHRLRTSLSPAPRGRNLRRPCRLSLEALEGRCLLSTDGVLPGGHAVPAALRADNPAIGFETRDMAIEYGATHDTVYVPAPAVERWVAEQTLILQVTDGAGAVVNGTPGTAPGGGRPAPPAFRPRRRHGLPSRPSP